MKFEAAVAKVAKPTPVCARGLGAMKRGHDTKVRARDTRRIAGSVDLDSHYKNHGQHHSARWDYAIGWRLSSKDDGFVFVEVHPASTSNVSEMVAKLDWLLKWLKDAGASMQSLKQAKELFVWVATEAGVHINPNSAAMRQYREAGGSGPYKICDLDRLF